MRMRQITAASMQEALRIARKELGDEAVMLETRKLTGGRGVTVVFAVDEREHDLFAEQAPEAVAVAPAAAVHVARAASRPAPLAPAATVVAPGAKPASAYEILERELRNQGLPEALQQELLEMAQATKTPPGDAQDAAELLLTKGLAAHLQFQPIETGAQQYPPRALMFVGPYGAGKTTALAKIATQLRMAKKNVVLITTDTEHLGAADTLEHLSAILQCPLHVISKRALLRELVKQSIGDAWVLIDSGGVNIYEFQQMKALGEFAGLQGIEPILVCAAGMDGREAEEMAGVFSFLPIERMLISRTDATRRFSSVFAALKAGGYALCNMTHSSKPSEAAVALSAPALARLMLRGARERGSQ